MVSRVRASSLSCPRNIEQGGRLSVSSPCLTQRGERKRNPESRVALADSALNHTGTGILRSADSTLNDTRKCSLVDVDSSFFCVIQSRCGEESRFFSCKREDG